MVGRLPDVAGAASPSYLLTLIAKAANYRRRKVTDYSRYFGLSTQSWRKSTELSLFNVFGIKWNDSTGTRNGHFAPFAWTG